MTNIVIFLLPNPWLQYWDKWGILFDPMGLASFAIQGALSAVQIGAPLSAVLVAATLTGSGGGMDSSRDLGQQVFFLFDCYIEDVIRAFQMAITSAFHVMMP
ncbi:TRIC cation channel family protein [Halobacillus hunanensis]|uniref:TRIC cation channel family protein n=1 Tax=Halobacillus hunanensis TaxID=578214 RepID=UPI00318313A2